MDILKYYINVARENIGANEDNYDALFLSALHRRMTPRAIELMVKEYADKDTAMNDGSSKTVKIDNTSEQAKYGVPDRNGNNNNYKDMDSRKKHRGIKAAVIISCLSGEIHLFVEFLYAIFLYCCSLICSMN